MRTRNTAAHVKSFRKKKPCNVYYSTFANAHRSAPIGREGHCNSSHWICILKYMSGIYSLTATTAITLYILYIPSASTMLHISTPYTATAAC
jgi:hypothetical protein